MLKCVGMKIILLKNVPKLGQAGDIKEVSDGYAMNMLLPRGLAAVATPARIAQEEASRQQKEAAKAQDAAQTIALVKESDGKKFEIKAKADKTGHLYQKIDSGKVADVIGAPASVVQMSEPLKEVGEHAVSLVFEKVHATATVAIVAE